MKRQPRARAKAESGESTYQLSLFIAGATPHSASALSNLVALCEERLHGRYELVVIDVHQDAARAKAANVFAVPTLIKTHPLPPRRMIGDLSDRRRVLAGLDLPPDLPKRHDENA